VEPIRPYFPAARRNLRQAVGKLGEAFLGETGRAVDDRGHPAHDDELGPRLCSEPIFPFIIGFPGEPDDSMRASLEVAKSLRSMSPGFRDPIFYFKPYPARRCAERSFVG
jgi:hypothetical protein